ncbi:MAG: hypothetical protein SW833_12215 [Cyanobacteriota bacterium]|nr:hypothetical protein [Cyanobacteriota bacterium]
MFRETIHQTSSKLTIEAKPHWGWIAFFPLWGLTVSGIWFGWLTANQGIITLTCQKNQQTEVTCNRSASRFFGFVEQPAKSLGTVSQAQLTSTTRTNSEGYRYTVDYTTLTTSEGQINVFEGNLIKMQDYVAQINAFTASNESSFIATQDTREEVITEVIMFIAFLSAGFVFSAFALKGSFRIITRTLDKTRQRLIYRSKGLFKTQEESYPFKSISGVQVKEYIDVDDYKSYCSLVTIESDRSGSKSVRLKENDGKDIEKEKKFAEQVRNFLQLETPIEIVKKESTKTS